LYEYSLQAAEVAHAKPFRAQRLIMFIMPSTACLPTGCDASVQGVHTSGAIASSTSGAGLLDDDLLSKLEQLLTCPISHISTCKVTCVNGEVSVQALFGRCSCQLHVYSHTVLHTQ
jgi:hypothetical protein